MIVQFADTYYFLALVNPNDRAHAAARRCCDQKVHGLVTTTWVLVEFADALSGVAARSRAAQFVRGLLADPSIEVVPPTWEQFAQALNLYERRPDKEWSLTDCVSFVLMRERGITEALTADRHFEQAGFRALLRQTPP